MILALVVLASYLIGAIPVGVIAAQLKGVDILKFGSGNPGATNVGRALGRRWFFIVFVLDALKGLVPALLGHLFFPNGYGGLDVQPLSFLFGIVAVLGHSKSPFIGFRGGKGVSTALGAGIGSAPVPALMAFALFGVVLGATRYMSVASVTGVVSAFFFGWLIPGNSPQMLPLYAILGAYVTYAHRANFGRLARGEEPKLGEKKPAPDESP